MAVGRCGSLAYRSIKRINSMVGLSGTTMSSERIFNIFVFFENGTATEYGMRHHRLNGSDEEKLTYLQGAVEADFPSARRFPLRRTFTPGQWLAQQRQGMDLGLFEKALALYRAPREPVMCLTAIDDGVPRIDLRTDLSPYRGNKIGNELPGAMQDWLVNYTEGSIFRFDTLINDDYFAAIKILFNARHIASASKLLMSCIDTLAFVEYGDKRGNFVLWLDAYVDLVSLGITSTEMWEFRNSIVHMTNLSSRAVLAGKVSTIMPYIGSDELAKHARSKAMKPFNLHGLILAISAGIGRWAETYNADRDKFTSFIERYDTIISDSRLAEFASAQE